MADRDDTLKVFISYSRADRVFAGQLQAALTTCGFKIGIDQEAPGGVAWWDNLRRMIRECDTVVFVLTPSSAKSSHCADEVKEALALKKRILTLTWLPLGDAPSTPDGPLPLLSHIQSIFFYDDPKVANSGFGNGLARLVEALNLDFDWILDHTRYMERAVEWQTHEKPVHLLLNGPKVAEAKTWLARRPKKAPELTPLHLEYIAASEAAEKDRFTSRQQELDDKARTQKRARVLLIGLAALALAMFGGAGWQAHENSRRETKIFESKAVDAFVAGQFDRAIRFGLAGLPPPGSLPLSYHSPVLEDTIRLAHSSDRTIAILSGHSGAVSEVSFSPNGKGIVTRSVAGRSAKLWDGETGMPIAVLEGGDGGTAVIFSKSGAHILSTGRVVASDGSSRQPLWDARTGKLINLLPQNIRGAEFSADGRRIIALTNTNAKAPGLWEVDTAAGASITAEPASAAITWLRFNPDGKRIVGEMGSALALWNSETGQLIGELKGHKGSIRDETFSHDGRLLASWAWDDPDVRLWEPQSGSVKVLPGTTDGKAPAITGARFSEQGARLVTRSADSVWLWDTATGNLVAKLAGIEGLLKRVDIHDNGTRLLTTGQKEKSARLWDAANKGELVGVLGGHIGELEQAAFNKEGNRILTTAKGDASVRLWNAIDGSLIREMKKHNTPVLSAFFDASGSRIVTRAENDTVVMLWDANSGDLVNQLEGHTGQVRFARLDAAGTLLVTTGAADKVVRLWDTKSGALAASLDGHGGIITDMQFSPDGLRLLSRASNDEAARLWDLSGRDNLKSFPLRGYALSGAAIEEKGDVAAIYESSGPAFERPGSVLLARAGETMTTITLSGHTKAVRDVTLYANGKRLLSSEGDENNPSTELKLWNTETGDLLNTVIHGGKGIPLNSVRISADGQQLVTRAEGSASLHLWNGMTGEHIKELTGHRAPVTAAFMTENGVRLISQARGDKAVLVWDGKTGARVSPGQLEGHATSVARFVVASKGDRFATAAEGSAVIKLWNGATGTLIGDLAGHAGTSIESMAFSKDDSQLISRAKDDAVARIWSAANGGLVYELKGQPDALTSAFFSDDGRHAYTASNNGRDARLWSLATGKEVTKFAGHEGGGLIVTTTSLPDSRWRVSRAAGDKVAQLWDNQSGQHVSRLTGHVGSVRTTKFTKDGKRLLTRADTDPDARLWDIERRGALVRVLGPHRDAVVDVLITKDDSLIVTQAAADPIVRLWDAKTGGPIAELGFRNTAPVSKMFLVNDDTRLMTFSGNVVRLWDIRKYNLSREKEPFQLVCGDGQGLMSKRQFNAVEMRDPILEAFSTQRQPCDRPGPLRWAYWQHLFAAEAEVAK